MFLASDAAGFVTGTLLPIDGGTTAQIEACRYRPSRTCW